MSTCMTTSVGKGLLNDKALQLTPWVRSPLLLGALQTGRRADGTAASTTAVVAHAPDTRFSERFFKCVRLARQGQTRAQLQLASCKPPSLER